MLADARLSGLVDIPALERWLDCNVPQLGSAPLRADIISGGASNIVIALDRGGMRAVLRRPPERKPPNSQKAMERESTILRALNQTEVPHPHLYGYCGSEEVIGSNFYVMELIDGWSAQVTING